MYLYIYMYIDTTEHQEVAVVLAELQNKNSRGIKKPRS